MLFWFLPPPERREYFETCDSACTESNVNTRHHAIRLHSEHPSSKNHVHATRRNVHHAVRLVPTSTFSVSHVEREREEMSVQQARAEPGHVLGGQEVNVAPDVRCPASVILAAFNVFHKTPRTDGGLATTHENIQREERHARSGLTVLRRKAREHRKVHFTERLLELAGGVRAGSSDFNVFVSAVHHRIVVEPATADHSPQVLGKREWATGL